MARHKPERAEPSVVTGIVTLQMSPAGGSPLAYLGTVLLAAGVYAVTVHIAARNVLGDVPLRRAAVVGVAVAVVVVVLQQYGLLGLVVAITADFVLIRYVYRLRLRTTGLVTLVHVVVSVLLLFVVLSAYRLIGTAPG